MNNNAPNKSAVIRSSVTSDRLAWKDMNDHAPKKRAVMQSLTTANKLYKANETLRNFGLGLGLGLRATRKSDKDYPFPPSKSKNSPSARPLISHDSESDNFSPPPSKPLKNGSTTPWKSTVTKLNEANILLTKGIKNDSKVEDENTHAPVSFDTALAKLNEANILLAKASSSASTTPVKSASSVSSILTGTAALNENVRVLLTSG